MTVRELFRKVLARSVESMAHMSRGSHLGLEVSLAGDRVEFSFANEEMGDEFARLNGQSAGAGP